MNPEHPRPILLAHGALGSAETMQPLAAAFAALGDVTVLEFPGHGRTPLGDAPFSMETFASTIEQAVLDMSGPPPLVFGYSMGGYAALTLAARQPALLGGIVTFGTKFEWTPDIAASEALRLDADVIADKVPKFAAALEARHEAADGWRPVLARTASLLHDLGASPILTPDRLHAIPIPVRLAYGTRDESVSAAEYKRIAGAMPNAMFIALQDASHALEKVPVEMLISVMRGLRG